MQTTRQNYKRTFSTIVILTILSLLGLTDSSSARSGQFYLGITTTAEWLDTSYDKTVDNTDPSNDLPNQGRIYRDNDSTDGWVYGLGISAGYRIPLWYSGVFISGEIDAVLHDGRVEGRLNGAGMSEERNQLGENWPENYNFQKNQSYGLTIRLGISQDLIPLYESNIYAIAGVRLVQTEFNADYTGCELPTTCTTADDLTPGTLNQDQDLIAWTGGIGMEKSVGGKVAIRGEILYTLYEKEDWLTLASEERIRIPAEIDSDEAKLSLSFIWYL